MFFIFAGFLIWVSVRQYLMDEAFADTGIPTTGIVDSKSTSSGSKGETYYHVAYHFFPSSSSLCSSSGRVGKYYWNQISVGDSIAVIYLPGHPELSRIGRPGPEQMHEASTITPAVAALILITLGSVQFLVIFPQKRMAELERFGHERRRRR
jgi:hypothetical protein